MTDIPAHRLMNPAIEITRCLAPLGSSKLPTEILVLDQHTLAIVVEVSGVDYILTMMTVTAQRKKPATQ